MIVTLASKELKALFASPLAWVVLAFFQLILAWIFLARLDAFLGIQSQLVALANPPGATEIVVAPVFGIGSIVLVMAVPLLAMRLVAEERRNQTMTFLISAPLSMTEVVLGKFLGLFLFLLIPVLLIGVMSAVLAVGGRLDWGLVAANLIGLALLAAALAAIGLCASCLTAHPVLAAVAALALSLVLWMVNLATADPASAVSLISLLGHFEPFTKGVVDTASLAYFALLIGLFLLLAIRRLDADRLRGRRRLVLQNVFFVLLLVAATLLLVKLAQDYRLEWDLTENRRHTLSKSTADVLGQMKGPVTITAYATEQDAQLGDIRKIIRDFVTPYQRAKSDLTLKFIDPRAYPKLAAEAKVQANGELVIEYDGRSEHLTNLNEQAFTNLLMRLSRGSERIVAQLDGHGERRLTGNANHDLGDFGKQLQAKGLKLGTVNLNIAQDVPDNAALLVIASPQVDLLPGEVERVKRYLAKGGSLLWLIDQESLHGLQPVAEYLSLVLSPGIVVDPAALQMGLPQANALSSGYGNHAIVRDFPLNAVFPFARQIGVVEGKEWRAFPLVEVAQRGWIESGEPNDAATFDKSVDVPGPVTIGYALERVVDDRTQRVVVIGTGHFLANTYVGLLGNLDLGVNVVNWLVGDDDLITVQPRATLDSSLDLGRVSLFLIAAGFLVLLPLGFLAAGAASWWRRRQL